MTLLSPIVGVATAAVSLLTPVPLTVSLDTWEPEVGDRIVIDTLENHGFLIHADGRTIDFPLVTGQKRFVCYIGRCYNAKTPDTDWVMKSRHIKGDRLTYGKTGRFLRLYDEDGRTHYGIHGYGREDQMFEQKSRFQSMGCIIVREPILDIIEATFEINEGNVPVFTRNGVEEPVDIAFGHSLFAHK